MEDVPNFIGKHADNGSAWRLTFVHDERLPRQTYERTTTLWNLCPSCHAIHECTADLLGNQVLPLRSELYFVGRNPGEEIQDVLVQKFKSDMRNANSNK